MFHSLIKLFYSMVLVISESTIYVSSAPYIIEPGSAERQSLNVIRPIYRSKWSPRATQNQLQRQHSISGDLIDLAKTKHFSKIVAARYTQNGQKWPIFFAVTAIMDLEIPLNKDHLSYAGKNISQIQIATLKRDYCIMANNTHVHVGQMIRPQGCSIIKRILW